MTEATRRFDEQAALARLGGDQDLLDEVAEIYLDSYRDMVQGVRDALAADDAAALRSAAHLLKGTVANFGAAAATDLAFELERMGADDALAGAANAADDLAREADALADELMAYRGASN